MTRSGQQDKYWRQVRALPKKAGVGIVPPRRGSFDPLPGLDSAQAERIRNVLLGEMGVTGFERACTGEMLARPVPHVTRVPEIFSIIAEIYRRVLPLLYEGLSLRPPVQTYNLISRMGWPYFRRSPDKRRFVAHELRQALATGGASLKHGFTITNVRLQAEPAEKEREFQFVDSKGEFFDKTVTAEDRMIPVPWSDEPRMAERTRNVFVLPLINNALQTVDTMLNNALGRIPVTQHNMFSDGPSSRVLRYYQGIDVRHMERTTAAIIPTRNALIEGNYAAFHNIVAQSPYLSPSYDWRAYILYSSLASGWMVQFGSGHSAVSISQKEVVLAIIVWIAHTVFGRTLRDAVNEVREGRCGPVVVLNYGDDNHFSCDDATQLTKFLDHLQSYLPIQDDDGFLGFGFDGRHFRLRLKSYVLKTYLHERPPSGRFRKLPYLGWVEKRNAYLKYGPTQEATLLFAREDALLAQEGLPWRVIEERAAAERQQAALPVPPDVANAIVFGKDYLLSEEAKVEFAGYDGLSPRETAPIIRSLAGRRGLLRQVHDSAFADLSPAELKLSQKLEVAARERERELQQLPSSERSRSDSELSNLESARRSGYVFETA